LELFGVEIISNTYICRNESFLMNQYSNTFNAFRKQNILIIGDVMIDRYLSGKVDRISPEAPVPVVHLQQREDRLGGAANVALNLKSLGANPYLCSVIGNDKNADIVLELMPKHGLSTRALIKSKERVTTIKTRVIASNQHLLRVDAEDQHELSEAEAKQLLAQISELLEQKEIHAILLQDYNKGVLSSKLIRDITLEAIKRDIPTAVDPKKDNFWAYKHITLFKPNLKEIQAQLPFSLSADLSQLKDAAAFIRGKLGNQFTLITLSEKGLFYDNKEEAEIVPTQPRSIADVCGAGDTVFAIAGLGLATGMPMEEIAILANLSGGQVCEKVGVVPVDRNQLEQEYLQFKKNGSLV
jgi:rfaE bifunctional protein kinase chain/domain